MFMCGLRLMFVQTMFILVKIAAEAVHALRVICLFIILVIFNLGFEGVILALVVHMPGYYSC